MDTQDDTLEVFFRRCVSCSRIFGCKYRPDKDHTADLVTNDCNTCCECFAKDKRIRKILTEHTTGICNDCLDKTRDQRKKRKQS